MHRDKQNQFLTTFKKSILANKCGQIPHSALATALIHVKSSSGGFKKLRALIDSES